MGIDPFADRSDLPDRLARLLDEPDTEPTYDEWEHNPYELSTEEMQDEPDRHMDR